MNLQKPIRSDGGFGTGPKPPGGISKKFWSLVAFAALLFGILFFFKYANVGASLLWEASRGGTWLFPLVAVASLIDSINPCAFSVLLLTVAFLFSLGKDRMSILQIGSSYIFGIFLVYILIGLGILQALELFNTPHFMAKAGAALLILMGIVSLINEFFPRFPIKLKIPSAAHKPMAELMEKTSLPAAFFLGGLVGLCEFPCTGGPYLMILGLLHDGSNFLTGLGYLILYNLIFISPLVLILLIASERSLLEKLQEWKKNNTSKLRLYGGLAVIVLGLLIFAL